jgi:inosine-uridine nucleoside N-ribohydrolase
MEFASPSLTGARRPVIVDTDLSFDDYVALLYLLQHPAIDVRAITVANGVVHVKPGIENARRLPPLVGRTDTAVAGGPDKPLVGQHAFPASWRTPFDFIPRLMLPRAKVPPAPVGISAPELIRQQIIASDAPLTFIALGPLTNLALALQADPVLAAQVDTVFISGGAINVPGTIHHDVPSNPNAVAEWNLYIDPVAADIVFNSGARLVLIPLDVTHVDGPRPLLFSHDFVHRLATAACGRPSKLLVRFIRLWQLMSPQYQATPVWDAVTAAIVADPTIGCDWRDLALRVVTQPDQLAGQTVVDAGRPANARVCLAGDQTAFEAAYLTTVRGSSDKLTATGQRINATPL